jgi:hypothetical protein
VELNTKIVQFYGDKRLEAKLDLSLLKRGAFLAQNRENLKFPSRDDNSTKPLGISSHAHHPLTYADAWSSASFTSQDLSTRPRPSATAARGSEAEEIEMENNFPAKNEAPLPPVELIGTKEEEAALKRESTGAFKSLTKSSIIILATCALGAVAQGWTQQSIVGANLKWPIDLRIAKAAKNGTILWHYYDKKDSQDNINPDKGLKLFSLVNAITYFAASVLGAWVTDPLTYVKGRRFALLCAGVCTLGGPIGASYCETWLQLFFCRLIQGIGVGAKSSVVPVIESEVFQPEIRGRLLVSWQTFVAVGIFLGTCSNLIFHDNWRHQIGIAFIPAVPLLCLCYVIPEYVIHLRPKPHANCCKDLLVG